MTDLDAVRIDVDGTVSPLILPPHSDGRHWHVVTHFTGADDVGYAHYGRTTDDGFLAITVIVGEWSQYDQPPNPTLTRLVDAVRGGPLSYTLHGPAIVAGHDPHRGDMTDLPDEIRRMLPALAGGAS